MITAKFHLGRQVYIFLNSTYSNSFIQYFKYDATCFNKGNSDIIRITIRYLVILEFFPR